jgi:hypothetical protein
VSKVFVGGSRRISRLSADLRKRLDQIVEKQFAVLVGDANGADKAVQAYIRERQYPQVFVFCTAGECRNNLGDWPLTAVKPPHPTRDFEYFTAKDAAMAREADYGLMLWDGRSSGTLVNVARMVAAQKPVVLYVAPKRSFLTLTSRKDLERLLFSCPAEVRNRVGEYITDHAPEYAQPSIF